MFYGSQNFVTIMPDFLGFQDDDVPHPYVFYPKQIVQEALAALDDAYDYLTFLYPTTLTPFPLYSVGYSEGGAYSVWMAKYLQQQGCSQGCNCIDSTKYMYVKTVGLEGAYDLETMRNFLITNVGVDHLGNPFEIETTAITTMGKPGFSVLALLSYCYYDFGSYIDFFRNTNTRFYNMACDVEKNFC